MPIRGRAAKRDHARLFLVQRGEGGKTLGILLLHISTNNNNVALLKCQSLASLAFVFTLQVDPGDPWPGLVRVPLCPADQRIRSDFPNPHLHLLVSKTELGRQWNNNENKTLLNPSIHGSIPLTTTIPTPSPLCRVCTPVLLILLALAQSSGPPVSFRTANCPPKPGYARRPRSSSRAARARCWSDPETDGREDSVEGVGGF